MSISFLSCNKKETSSYTIIPEDTIHQNYPDTFEPKKDTLQFCYLSVVGKDSLHLSYTLYPTDSVKGKMSYDNFEKDGSTGKVYGIKSGDTLKETVAAKDCFVPLVYLTKPFFKNSTSSTVVNSAIL